MLGILLVGAVVGGIVGGLLGKQNPTTTTTKTTTTATTTTTTTATTTSTTTTSTTTSTTTATSTTTTTTSSTTTTTTTTSTTTTTTTTSTATTTTTVSTTTTTTTASTTTTTITTSTTTSTTSTTTKTTSTTTTRLYCGQSCLNETWINSSSDLALWPFDGSYNDTTSGYNGSPSLNQPTFVTGYFNQACSFNTSAKQALYTSFIPLNNISFTIETWIKPTGYPNPTDHGIVGLCPIEAGNRCLHITIRNTKLHFGFYSNDCEGSTTISLNQWIHTAFVFDLKTKIQTIYLNGFQDGQNSGSSALLVTSGNFTIGMNEQGYIDHLSITQRAKSSCEILEIATLTAHFEFDNASPYTDSGPYPVATTYSNTSIISGYENQGISFSGSSTSYFQAWGFTSLGISNHAFSITFWIKPEILSGTLVHLSSSPSGNGSTCFPLLGFATNGAIVAQILINNGTILTTTGPILSVSISWIPVVQTWSVTNGLKLYVNNTLVSSIAASIFKGSGLTPNYLTLGNCLSGCSACSSGLVASPGPFKGAIDEWRIYNRELTSVDVCTLFSTT
ncbi:unnamed protein product [Adineta steineri]|nr:unnamed protein product [Adineta steineri]